MSGYPSPASVVVDEDGNVVLVQSEGGNRYLLSIRDEEQFQTMQNILKELRIMNIYLAQLCGGGAITRDEINGEEEQ